MNSIDYSKFMTPEFGYAMGKGFAEAMAQAEKATLPSNSTWNLIHGRGSLFGGAAVGLEPDVISTMMHWDGLGEHLLELGWRVDTVPVSSHGVVCLDHFRQFDIRSIGRFGGWKYSNMEGALLDGRSAARSLAGVEEPR